MAAIRRSPGALLPRTPAMTVHGELLTRLLGAARAGGDLLAILASAAEHLEVCPSCRASAGTLLDTVLPLDQTAQLQLQALEEAGQLAEPPSYPRFDLSFLEPITAPTIW